MKKKNAFLSALLALAMLFGIGGVSSVIEADAATQRYEAETATLTGGGEFGIKSDYGDGWVDKSMKWVGSMDANSAIAFTVNVDADGEYALSLRYASAADGATLKVFNGDGYYTAVSCPRTHASDWGIFQTATSAVSLRAGTNTVTIKKGDSYAELDWIEIGEKVGDYVGGSGSVDPNDITAPTAGYTRYEAENSTLNKCRTENGYGTFSGTGFAVNLDYADSYVEFKVSVSSVT